MEVLRYAALSNVPPLAGTHIDLDFPAILMIKNVKESRADGVRVRRRRRRRFSVVAAGRGHNEPVRKAGIDWRVMS